MSFWVSQRKRDVNGRWWLSIGVPPIVVLVIVSVFVQYSLVYAAALSWNGAAVVLLAGAAMVHLAQQGGRFRAVWGFAAAVFLTFGLCTLLVCCIGVLSR